MLAVEALKNIYLNTYSKAVVVKNGDGVKKINGRYCGRCDTYLKDNLSDWCDWCIQNKPTPKFQCVSCERFINIRHYKTNGNYCSECNTKFSNNSVNRNKDFNIREVYNKKLASENYENII